MRSAESSMEKSVIRSPYVFQIERWLALSKRRQLAWHVWSQVLTPYRVCRDLCHIGHAVLQACGRLCRDCLAIFERYLRRAQLRGRLPVQVSILEASLWLTSARRVCRKSIFR